MPEESVRLKIVYLTLQSLQNTIDDGPKRNVLGALAWILEQEMMKGELEGPEV